MKKPGNSALSADLEIPFEYDFFSAPIFSRKQVQYGFKHSGLWFAGSFEYDVYRAPGWQVSLWAKGSWYEFKGGGSQNYRDDVYLNGVPFAPPLTDYNSSDGKLTGYSIGGGLQFRYSL